MKLIPIRDACSIFGLTVESIKAHARKDPSFPALQLDPPKGPWRVDADGVEPWKMQQRKRRVDAFVARCRETETGPFARPFVFPDALLQADAADHLRHIMRHGTEPDESTHWRNAAMLTGDPPPDVQAGLKLQPGCGWGATVRRAELLLSLDAATKARTLVLVHKRLDQFYAAEEATDALDTDGSEVAPALDTEGA